MFKITKIIHSLAQSELRAFAQISFYSLPFIPFDLRSLHFHYFYFCRKNRYAIAFIWRCIFYYKTQYN